MYTKTSLDKAINAISDMAEDFYTEYDLIFDYVVWFNDRCEVFWNSDNVEDVERLMELLRKEGFEVRKHYGQIMIPVNF